MCPEVLDRRDGGEKLVQVGGLLYVAVGAKLIGSPNIVNGVRTGKNNDGNFHELGIGLQSTQNFVAAQSRNVQVENNEVGTGSAALDKFDCTQSVFYYMDIEHGAIPVEAFLD